MIKKIIYLLAGEYLALKIRLKTAENKLIELEK
jgi:hypothetical protein